MPVQKSFRSMAIALIVAGALSAATGGSVLASDGDSSGACNMVAMLASTATPNGGATNMMDMSAQGMDQMMAVMTAAGCSMPG